MAHRNRALTIFALLLGGAGVLFLLWGLDVNVGRWWPAIFAAIGLASFARGMRERGNVVVGLLLVGWSAAAILALHSEDLGISHGIPFFIGVFILWMPATWLLARVLSPGRQP